MVSERGGGGNLHCSPKPSLNRNWAPHQELAVCSSLIQLCALSSWAEQHFRTETTFLLISKVNGIEFFFLCRVDGIPVHHAVRLIMPDIGVFVVAVVVLVVCTIILRRKSDAVQEPRKRVTSLRRQKALNYAVTVVTEVFVMVALAASSIMIPSVSKVLFCWSVASFSYSHDSLSMLGCKVQ